MKPPTAIIFREEQGVWVSYGAFDFTHLQDFLKVGRDQTRADLEENFANLFKRKVRIRFTDECVTCKGVMTKYGCENPECENGKPGDEDLAALMRDNPPGQKESAHNYLLRLREIWAS